jgi:hypothetical protein
MKTSVIADVFGFDVTGKDKEGGRWDFECEMYSYETGKVHGRAKRCEYAYSVSQSGKTQMEIKVYDVSNAKDCDGWTLRIFNMSMEGVVFSYMENGYISGTGFVTKLGYFTDEDYPTEQIAEGYVDSCFPTDHFVGSDTGSAFKVEFRLIPRSKR